MIVNMYNMCQQYHDDEHGEETLTCTVYLLRRGKGTADVRIAHARGNGVPFSIREHHMEGNNASVFDRLTDEEITDKVLEGEMKWPDIHLVKH